MSNLVSIANAQISRGGKILFSQFNLAIKPGEAIHLVGKNGSGKSTLASIIAGDLAPDEGTITYLDSPSNHKQMSKLRGVLPQQIDSNFPITAQEFLLMADEKCDCIALLIKLDLADIAEKKITELSQGQLQRLFLAQLLAQDPQLIILDEPFSAQDKENTDRLLEIFKELKAAGKALLIINHLELKADGLFDRVVSLNN